MQKYIIKLNIVINLALFWDLILFHIKEMVFKVKDIADLEIVEQELLQFTEKYTIFCFFGEVGAGKTTLITQFCKALGIEDKVSSPTYSIVQEYKYGNQKLFHIDLYRLNSEEEAFDIGLEDYLYSNNICLIEWPNDFLNLIPKQYVKIKLENIDGERNISIEA